MRKSVFAAAMGLALAAAAAFGTEPGRPWVAFDRPGGFTVEQGEDATITATLVGGSGGMWFSWEGNNGGTAKGDATFVIDTSVPGEYWLKAIGGSDGTDGDYARKIRFRVAAKEGAATKGTRAAGEGETLVWSEDFSGLSGNSTLSSYSGNSGTWTLFKGFNCSNDWLRLGTSSTNGYAISPSASLGGAAGRLEFGLALYGSDSTTVTLQRSTDGGTSWSDMATYSGFTKAMTTNSVDIPASASVLFKWSSDDKNKRFYLDNVAVYAAGGGGGTVESNRLPRLDLDPDVSEATVFVGKEFDLEVLATEYDGDEITLSASGLPEEAVWVAGEPATNSVLGLLEWTPTTTGTWNAVFSATDTDGTTNRPVTFTAVPEGPGSLTFESSGVNVRESSGLVSLTVIRTNGAAGAVGVSWATANGTASAGSEYTAGSGTLSFADGKTSQTLTVALIDDTASEDNKTFTVTLGNPTGGAVLGEIATCTVTIVDDDDANANYYASCYNNGVLKTGDTLKDALSKIINTGVKTNGYDSNLNTILNVIDACPTNSSLVQCIYLQRGLSRSAYNKEHIWAQSHGIDEKDPGYSDLHHIRACNSTMNSTRGDKDFDNCQGKSGATTNNGCYYTSSAWEPPTSAKGDVARALLYMDVRYENKYNSKYDLELVNSVGTSTSGNTLGKLSTLLAWHELDPVDDFERQRNELIYTTYQYNRNPFIDHPTWVKAVFDPSNFTPENITWTVNVTVSGNGWVNNYDSAFTAQVTNGMTKTFYSVPDTTTYYHIGSISWNGELVPQAYYTNAAYYNYTTPTVTNNATLAVVFDPDLAALGTPLWWLEEYGGNAPSVTGGNWDAAELEDWNDDGVLNWEEYVNGTDPTALNLRQVTNVTVSAATASGFTVGWDAVDYVDGYRVRVCSTAVVDAASAGFESGLDAGWSTNTVGTAVTANAALDGAYGLSFGTNGAWLCSTAVTNPVAVEFKYKRSSSTAAWTLVVEVSADGTRWTEAGSVTNATTTMKTATVELSDWYGQTVFVRLRDARESGSAARYVDAVTVRTGGATVAEGTPTGTSWTATGLSAGTGYDVRVRGEAVTLAETVGPWSAAVRATTATDDSGRMEQAITFPAIADQIATNTVMLNASADSGLPVVYAVNSGDPAVLDGTTLTFTGAGTVSVTASQEGNEEYAPAVSVTREFAVTKASQGITFGEIADQVETATVQLSATADSGLAVSFSVTSGPAVLDGTTLSFTGTGTVTVTVSQGGNALWAAAEDVTRTFEVTEVQLDAPASAWAAATNDTSFTAAWSVVTGAEGYELSVWTGGADETVATTNVTTLFSTDFPDVSGKDTSLSSGFIEGWTCATAYKGTNEIRVGSSGAGGNVTSAEAGATGTVQVVTRARVWGSDSDVVMWVGVTGCASQSNVLKSASDVYTNTFEGVLGTLRVSWSNAVGKKRFYLEEVSASEIRVTEETVSGTEPVPGYEARAVAGTSCAVTGLTAATTYEFRARATAGSATGAWSETATVTTLAQGGGEGQAQSITFGTIADQVVGATMTLDATATSGLTVTYSVSGPATLEGNVLTCTGAGTVTVTASQSGNGVWAAAADVTQTFEVSKKTQSITFGMIADQVVGATVTLDATATSEQAVTFAVSGPATLEGNVLTCTGVGTVTVTASQSGNGEWSAAADVVRSFAVTAAPAELAVPANVWASATNETTFTAAWSAVSGAEGYELMVWTGGGTETVTTTNETTLFSTNFESVVGNGNTELTNGFIEGWTVTKAYAGTNEVRVGASSALGWVKSATVGATGTVKVVTHARAWGTDSTVLWVGVTGCDSQTNTLSSTSAGFTNVFENVEGAVTVCWSNATASKQRFFLEDVSATEIVVTEGSEAGIEPVPGYEARAVDGTTCVVTGLTASTEYGFKVRAVADGESSDWSADAAVTTLAARQAQTITFGAIANQTVGDTVTLAATANSGLTVSYSVSGPATLSGNVLTCTGVGSVTVTASQAGNEQYAAAEDVSQSFTVAKRTQTIAFNAIGNQVATNVVTLSAAADSGLEVTFAVASGPAEVNGTTLTFTGAGEVTITATQAGNGTYASATANQTFTVTKAMQSITFGAIAGQSVNDTVTLNATASSGLSVSYTVSGPATIAGNVVTCTGAGTVTVTANQSGDAMFEVATPVERSFEVSLVEQSITFDAIGNQVATNIVTLSATADSGLDVTFAVASGPAEVNGSTLTFTGAGEVTVTASQAGNGMYASASENQTFTVTKAAQSINFPTIAGQAVGATVTLGATASSGLTVNYTVSGPATLSGNVVSCTGAGTVTVTASQGGNALYAAAADVVQTFEVALVSQTITFDAIGNQVATNVVTLSATADSGLEVTFTVTSGPAMVDGSTLTFTGAGEVMVTATQTGNATYAPAMASQTFTVTKAGQSITFPAIAGQSVNDTVTLDATASSGLEVSYTVSGPATLEGNTLTCTGAGTVTVTASQEGNAQYAAAENVVQTIAVSLVEQSIMFSAVGDQVATNTVTLSATATSGLDVTFAVTSGPAMLSGSTLTFLGAGEVTVTATQAGNGTYSSTTAGQTFTVSKAPQSINFPTSAGQSVGGTVTLDATASSGLAVSYAVSGPATLAGDTLTCTGAGTVTVTASQAGNDLYAAAENVVRTFEVSLVNQTVDFSAIGDQVATNTVTLSATATSGLDVTFAVTSGPAEVNGTTLMFTGAGDVTITATQEGNTTYAAAVASQSFTVSKAVQSITFDAIAGKAVGDVVPLDAMASSGLSVSYAVSGPATLEGNTLTCTASGTVTVTAGQSGNAIYEAAADVVQEFEVSLLAQTIGFDAIGDQVATNTVILSATASSGLDVTFAVTSGLAMLNGSTLTFTGAGEVTVTATQAGNGTYASTTASQTFTVAKAAQDITFPAIAGQSVGGSVTLSATASSGLAVSYEVSGPATLAGDTLTCTGAGTVTVTASQAGNDLYAAAENVVRTFEVSLVNQTIDFSAIGDQVATNTVTLSATATSGLDVTFAVTSGPAEVNGTTLTFTGAGEVTVTATQAGNGTYASATASQTFMVSKVSQSITFDVIAGKSVGDVLTLDATASSGLTVGYTVGGPATLIGNTLTCTGAGPVTVTASQAGNELYAAAEDVVQEFTVSLVAQSIAFETIGNQVATNVVTLTATADSGLEVTFAVTSGPAVLDGTMLTFTGEGEVTVTASQAGDATYASATASQTFAVEKAVAEVRIHGLAQAYDGSERAVEAVTEPSDLPVVVTYDGSEIAPTDAGEYAVSVVVEDAIWAGSASGTLVVSKGAQRITFAEIGAQVATNTVELEATATSGLAVTYVVASGPAVVAGATLTFTGTGTVTVTASQGGDGNWEAAESVTRTFEVLAAEQGAYVAWLEGWGLSVVTEGLEYEGATEEDYDGDGASNWKEYLADTNPADSEEFLRLAVELKAGTWLAKPVPVRAGRSYVLVTRTDLADEDTESEIELGIGVEGLAATNSLPEGGSVWFGIIRATIAE